MYINELSWRHPLTAIEWISYLADEDQRELARITAARRWLLKDPGAAETWLASSPLSEEAREKAHFVPHNMPGAN